MVFIRFRNAEDAQRLYSILICRKSSACEVSITQSPENMIRIECLSHPKVCSIHTWLVPALTAFITSQIEGRWMREMIRELFYFTDEDEQEQILSLAQWLLEGAREEDYYKQHIQKLSNRVRLIEAALEDFLTPNVSFSFESFLHFRLKDYRDCLYTTVELAIDEYKLEQEYQAFVEQLRYYLAVTESLFSELHVIEEDEYEVYTSSMNKIEAGALSAVIDPKIWRMEGFNPSASILAPLVSAAPQRLFYYTDRVEDGIVQTLMNVFQERMTICSKSAWRTKKESQIQS